MFRKALRLGTLMLVILFLLGSLPACKGPASSDEKDRWSSPTETSKQTEYSVIDEDRWSSPTETATEFSDIVDYSQLTVWSYSDEIKVMTRVFMDYNPYVEVEYVEFSSMDELYRQSVLAAANTYQCPDVIVMDSSFVEEFVSMDDLLMDISDLEQNSDALDIYPNIIEAGINDKTGELRAVPFQYTPGAVIYRRSLAREYFGTDDPNEIQEMMSDWEKYTGMAETVRVKSKGKSYMLSSVDELVLPFLNNRQLPWIVENKLTIDPKIEELTELSYTFGRNDYTAGLTPGWSEWLVGLTDDLTDGNGDKIQIFSYFVSSDDFLSVFSHAGNSLTDGDWACVPGPMAYSAGGTWIGIMNHAAMIEDAKEFVRFVALDETQLTDWATGVYTQDYLADLNSKFSMPEGSETFFQPAGDFVSSQKVVESIIPFFDDSEMSDFLGGQNFYEAFATAALNCPMDVIHSDNGRIQELFVEALHSYAYGDMSKEDMLQSFRDSVQAEYPEIAVE
ncbi:MAG: carbohydrate ABC transporter substrate-binding protein [Clostridiaceae bacterium]|nr:carbohydrate ABC transporter substrate-binding protein [Clostridiaceae bacterium]